MTLTEPLPATIHMPPDSHEADSAPVRISGAAATKLQTINALKKQMGVKFKTVEFLNGLVEKPIDDLYEATLAEFDAFKGKKGRKKNGNGH